MGFVHTILQYCILLSIIYLILIHSDDFNKRTIRLTYLNTFFIKIIFVNLCNFWGEFQRVLTMLVFLGIIDIRWVNQRMLTLTGKFSECQHTRFSQIDYNINIIASYFFYKIHCNPSPRQGRPSYKCTTYNTFPAIKCLFPFSFLFFFFFFFFASHKEYIGSHDEIVA